jgi:hypothetical protein
MKDTKEYHLPVLSHQNNLGFVNFILTTWLFPKLRTQTITKLKLFHQVEKDTFCCNYHPYFS